LYRFTTSSPRGRSDNPAIPTPIIIDCDPGHDDAIALLLALASPELELLGVTTTYGNQTLEKTTANALRVLELAGRSDVPVAAGAAEPLERELAGTEPDAIDAEVEFRDPAQAGPARILRGDQGLWIAGTDDALHASLLLSA